MANGWSLLVGFVVVAIFCLVSWFAAPKGENRSVWRSTLILSASSCFLMWAITFLAQLHPLIQPIRSDLRADIVNNERLKMY
ncbi:hypothetical protein EV356DRAFT_530483 [Viridothelium virens]|uniref:Uncharacterized protein n=1 Tax=Viridothelium virens TaxID=1048519 RepID=A0A6A6HGE8_VIRVR|nr:hypothetical protein EV356DRAFT_530483 [Viridothelium virens]